MKLQILFILSLLLLGCAGPTAPIHTEAELGIDARNPLSAACHWRLSASGAYLQDSICTPGAIFNVTKKEICVPGYTARVRNVSEKLKESVYNEYGITDREKGEYEIDHLIPLTLGGSNDITNLFPQPAAPKPGFHEKDTIEVRLNKKVCKGELTLEEAQRIIATDWSSEIGG
jgi:hypothetical protein